MLNMIRIPDSESLSRFFCTSFSSDSFAPNGGPEMIYREEQDQYKLILSGNISPNQIILDKYNKTLTIAGEKRVYPFHHLDWVDVDHHHVEMHPGETHIILPRRSNPTELINTMAMDWL